MHSFLSTGCPNYSNTNMMNLTDLDKVLWKYLPVQINSGCENIFQYKSPGSSLAVKMSSSTNHQDHHWLWKYLPVQITRIISGCENIFQCKSPASSVNISSSTNHQDHQWLWKYLPVQLARIISGCENIFQYKSPGSSVAVKLSQISSHYLTETYLEPSGASMTELFVITVIGFSP